MGMAAAAGWGLSRRPFGFGVIRLLFTYTAKPNALEYKRHTETLVV